MAASWKSSSEKSHLKKKEISNGAERRNTLVHRPIEQKIDRQESIDYVSDVEQAIRHLLKDLYPDIAIGRFFVG